MAEIASAWRDLRVLWATRRSSGFPWPFQGVYTGTVIGGWSNRLHILVFGQWKFSTMPLWKRTLRIPLRPYRYARMVRAVARARNLPFSMSAYDDVA